MKKLLVAILLAICVFLPIFSMSYNSVSAQSAAEIRKALCDKNLNAAGCATDNLTDILSIIVDTLLFALAGTCVVVVIIGGVRFTTSGGNAESVTKAKNSILYGIIGIVVAFSAYAIVHFVIGRFS